MVYPISGEFFKVKTEIEIRRMPENPSEFRPDLTSGASLVLSMKNATVEISLKTCGS
jgi:hypothetical protein